MMFLPGDHDWNERSSFKPCDGKCLQQTKKISKHFDYGVLRKPQQLVRMQIHWSTESVSFRLLLTYSDIFFRTWNHFAGNQKNLLHGDSQ